jgi:hypothetical protein
MPGFLGGGGSGSSGTGGEIRFPKEFIDPVTKLRISQPENLIDTDFEYGLQPTKWETVELINNTPSFFSKSGDTTIPGIASISTNTGTREITVTTATDHGLAVGIPINVTGTKSVTADGSYIINSIPNTTTFTYLCKDIQQGNNAIEDLYTSIITGEFFQGSQIRIADAEGIITDGEATSTLTVKTDSTHGFGLNTPFYFLNLNSTISQEFEASNTAAKSFDSSNSATAQTFDGSNTLSTFNIDWSNSATVGGVTSTISGVDTVNDTITVTHGAETFAGRPLGTPVYYNLTVAASSGYFFSNPRGVVFIKTTNTLNSPAGTSTFQVSATPDGDVIDIVSSMSGTFQLANQARTFAGNNVNSVTESTFTVIKEAAVAFDGANDGSSGAATYRIGTIIGYNNTLVQVTSPVAEGSLGYYDGAMVFYSTTGSAATGLTNNTTYFVSGNTLVGTAGGGTLNLYNLSLRALPTSSILSSLSGGTGTQTLTRIGVSIDKNIVHVRDSAYQVKDMLYYTYPSSGRFAVADNSDIKNYYFVETAYDTHNYTLSPVSANPIAATGGTITTTTIGGVGYKVHTFSASTSGQSFVVTNPGSTGTVEVIMWGGGGGAGGSCGRSGGGGAYAQHPAIPIAAGTYTVWAGAGGSGAQNGCLVNTGFGPGAAGYGSGGNGSNPSNIGCSSPGGGGGAGSFFLNGSTIVMAAGGGGGGGGSEGGGGDGFGGGGGQNGGSGVNQGSGGATGGQGGQNGESAQSAGGFSDQSGAGGGGGGFRGGNRGNLPQQDGVSGGGGGGGSSSVPAGGSIINGNRTTPGNSGDALRGSAGNGGGPNSTASCGDGNGASGTGGVVIIRYPSS